MMKLSAYIRRSYKIPAIIYQIWSFQAVNVNIAVFWDVTPCSLLYVYMCH